MSDQVLTIHIYTYSDGGDIKESRIYKAATYRFLAIKGPKLVMIYIEKSLW